jgi:peptide/nickel transport system permease protein
MVQFILRRILTSLVVLALVCVIAFSVMALIPGDPAAVLAGVGAPADQIEAIREQFGLTSPFPIRLGRWIAGVMTGDLGQSITLGQSVLTAVASRLPATFSLAFLALVWTFILGIGAGFIGALRRNSILDHLVMAIAVLGVSIPSFWLGLMLIVLFGVILEWLPTGGYVSLVENPIAWFRSLLLPSIALALLQIGLLARITRGALLEVLRQDYIRTAHAKGLPLLVVYGKHALMNAAVPIATVTGTIFSLMLSGAVVIETVFSIPGIGSLMANAVVTRDYPVIQGALIITATMFITINLTIDLLYAWLDPRIRYE